MQYRILERKRPITGYEYVEVHVSPQPMLKFVHSQLGGVMEMGKNNNGLYIEVVNAHGNISMAWEAWILLKRVKDDHDKSFEMG